MDKLKKIATNKMVWIAFVACMIIIIATSLAVYMITYEKTKSNIASANAKEQEENIIQQENLVDTSMMSEEELQKLNEEELEQAEQEEKETEKETKKEESEKKSNTTTETTKSKYYIKINYGAQVVTIYTYDENGNYTVPVKACICSTGTATPTSGVYKISWKATWGRLYGNVWGHYCCRVVGDILIHSVPYKQAASDTLISKYYDQLGTKASMGCIRLTTADAKWIYDNCTNGTQVEFYTSSDPGPLGKPTAKKVSDAPGDLKNWDPTDPDPNNPWKTYVEEESNTNSETTNSETTNNETTNNETTNSETTNNETTNSETANSGTTNSETTNNETTNSETTNNETTNNETTNSETTNSETTNNETTNVETTNSESANNELDET